MRKTRTLTALAAAATLGIAAIAAPQPAEARGGAVAAGIIGGAIANSAGAYPAYAPAPGYVVYQGYGAPYPAACPGGYWARRPLHDAYGNFVGWSRPRFICP